MLLHKLEGHKDYVRGVALSYDCRTVVTGSEDRTIKWWHLSTGKEIRTLEGHASYVTSVDTCHS